MPKDLVAEVIGPEILVLLSCGAAVLLGAHPALSLCAFVAGRIGGATLTSPVVAQAIGVRTEHRMGVTRAT